MYVKGQTATSLPLYVQISEVLIREIASGQLLDGVRLPPERALAKQHGTTVRTLRKALAILEKNGLIESIQGSGNYVRKTPDVASVYSMFRLELLRGGGLPTAKTLTVDELQKPVDLPQFGKSDRGTRIKRLRFLNQEPIAVEEIWLDQSAGKIVPAELSDSLYRYYKMRLGFWITHAEDYVSIGQVPDWAPTGFTPRPGQIVGFIERISYTEQYGSVEYSRTWFDPQRARYVQRLR